MNIKYSDLSSSDLIVNAVYESNGLTHFGGEVLHPLLGVQNEGGFRPKNNINNQTAYMVLEATNSNPDWIDEFDYEFGRVLYYGDNCEPGVELHNSPKGGNKRLYEYFQKLSQKQYNEIPPIFLFGPDVGRNRKFIGLVVPGDNRLAESEQLVAVWRKKNGKIYQNYKAIFTILDVAKISRKWIDDLIDGKGLTSEHAPVAWKKWYKNGTYIPLCTDKKDISHRGTTEQIPKTHLGQNIIKEIYNYFNHSGKKSAYFFELCAIRIVEMMDANYHDIKHTQFVKDGGRDAIGLYRIGKLADGIDIEFALEAKRYSLDHGVNVKDLSRLISRIRHRQFGVLVTTSYLNPSAYKELREDAHPIIVISAIDIVNILHNSGIKTVEEVKEWLQLNFPNH